jgi:site-specific DNA recombinase
MHTHDDVTRSEPRSLSACRRLAVALIVVALAATVAHDPVHRPSTPMNAGGIDMDIVPIDSRVIAYRRNSSDKQIHSLPDQTTVLERIVTEFQLELVHVFTDEGISGSTIDERDGLLSLLATAKNLNAKYLLTQNTDRLSRGGNSDFWPIIKDLKRAGIMVYSCMDRLLVTEANAPFFASEASQARGFNVKLSFNITRSTIESVRTRKNDPGRVPPYGYDRMRLDASGKPVARVRYYPNGTKVEMDPVTGDIRNTFARNEEFRKPKSQSVILVSGDPACVATLRRMATMIKTMGFTEIADRLNVEGIPPPRDKLWASSSVKSILENVVYTGMVVHGATTKAKYHRIHKDRPQQYDFLNEGKLNKADVPEEDQYRDPDRHEALIPMDEYLEIQAAIAARRRRPTGTPRSEHRIYILSGIAKCLRCGGLLHGHTQRGKNGEVYIRYTCSTARKNGPSLCPRYSLNGPELEESVLAAVREYFTLDCTKAALRKGLEALLGEREQSRTRIEAKRKEIAALEARKKKVFAMLVSDEDKAFFREQVDQLKVDERRLRRELSELEREEGAHENQEAFIERAMKHFEDHVLALKGGCENAIRESLIALGTEVFYDPDLQEGGLTIRPFGHSAAI